MSFIELEFCILLVYELITSSCSGEYGNPNTYVTKLILKKGLIHVSSFSTLRYVTQCVFDLQL